MHSYKVTILTAECIQVNANLRSARGLSVNPVTITIIVAYGAVSASCLGFGALLCTLYII